MSSCGSNADMKTSASLWSMPSPITLCFTPAHTSTSCCLKFFTSSFCLVDMLTQILYTTLD